MTRTPLKALFLFVPLMACTTSSGGRRVEEPDRSVVRVAGYQSREFFTEGDQDSAAFPVSADRVWEILPGVYAELEIPVTQSAPSRMTLGNPAYRARQIEGGRMGRYVDCGTNLSGQLANAYDVTLNLVTRVEDSPEGGAVVTTALDAWAEPRVTRGDPVHCRSRHRLESRISELVAEKLGSGGVARPVPVNDNRRGEEHP